MRRLLLALLIISLGVAHAQLGSFPNHGVLSDAAITEGEMKLLLENWVAASKHLCGGPKGSTLTIAGGSITPNRSFHLVYPQGGAATDDLTMINSDSAAIGHVVLLRTVADANDVVVIDGLTIDLQGTNTGGSFELEYADSWLLLERTGTAKWTELARGYGGAGSNWYQLSMRSYLGVLASDDGTYTTNLTGPQIRLTSTTALSLSSTAHAFQVGPTGAQNLRMSPTYFQAVNNGATASLYLNPLGGTVFAGSLTAAVWTSANDGTGSTLDADKLDGLEGTAYMNPPYARVWYDIAAGNAGQTSSTTWFKMYLTDTYPSPMSSGITGSSLATSVITLPSGTYRVDGTCVAYMTDNTRFRLVNTTADPDVVLGVSQSVFSDHAASEATATARIVCTFTLGATSAVELQGIADYVQVAGWGKATGLGTENEVYQTLQIWKVN